MLAYTGAPRQSGINNWEVFKQHIDGDRRIFRNFERIGEIARAMRAAVASADWAETGRLLREEWKLRRTNAPGDCYAADRPSDCRLAPERSDWARKSAEPAAEAACCL